MLFWNKNSIFSTKRLHATLWLKRIIGATFIHPSHNLQKKLWFFVSILHCIFFFFLFFKLAELQPKKHETILVEKTPFKCYTFGVFFCKIKFNETDKEKNYFATSFVLHNSQFVIVTNCAHWWCRLSAAECFRINPLKKLAKSKTIFQRAASHAYQIKTNLKFKMKNHTLKGSRVSNESKCFVILNSVSFKYWSVCNFLFVPSFFLLGLPFHVCLCHKCYSPFQYEPSDHIRHCQICIDDKSKMEKMNSLYCWIQWKDDMVKSLKRTQNNIICGKGFVRRLNSISIKVAVVRSSPDWVLPRGKERERERARLFL